jgi:hypothetical protein
MVGAAEVIAVAGLAQPAALAGLLAGPAAGRLGAVSLVIAVAIIRQEQLLATTALATRKLQTHDCVPTGEEEPATGSTPPSRKKTKGEEGRRVLSEDREENPGQRKWNFKPP